MLKKYLTSLVLVAFLAGCGSTFSNISAVPYPPEPEEPEAHFHFGGVRLAEPVAGALVQAQSLAVETDESGQFTVEGEVGSRVTARPPAGPTLALEVAEEEPGFLWLSPVTTMVSRYRQSHPGVSLALAEERVRAYLEIPEDVDLGSGLGDTWRSPFSWTAFVQAAGSVPLDLFIDQQVARIDAGPPRAFRLPDPYGALRQFMGASRVPDKTDFYSAVGNNLVAPFEQDTLVSVAGWVCEALGLNLPVSSEQLTDIASQLEQVSTDLEALAQELPPVEADLQAPLARIQSTTQGYARMVQAGPSATPGQPVDGPPSQAAAFATQLQGYTELDTDQQVLGAALLGPDSLPMSFARSLQEEVGRTEPGGESLFAEWRTNEILQKETDFTLFYQVYQALGLNLLAERSHLDGQSFGGNAAENVQAASMTAALSALRELATAIRGELQQVPPVTIASDDVMVDVPSGVMWYNQLSHLESSQVEPFLEDFTIAGLAEWRLPSLGELRSVRDQALAAGGGNPLLGLHRMGFKVDEEGSFLAEGNTVFSLRTGSVAVAGEEDLTLLLVRDCPGPSDDPGTLQAVATPSALAANIGAVQGTVNGQRLDYSSLVAWSSSDPSQLEVSNLPANLGELIFHRPVPSVSVVASLLTGYPAPEPTFVQGVVPRLPLGPTPTLQSLVVTPNNRVVSGSNVVLFATGQYSDKTVRDLTGVVTWTASQGTFAQNVLQFSGPGEVVVTATVNSTSARANFTRR